MSSYDPSQWYSYSKNRPNEVPPKIPVVHASCDDVDSSNLVGELSREDVDLSSDINPQPEPNGSDELQNKEEVAVLSVPGQIQSNSTKLNSFVKRLQKMVRELPR